MHILLHMIYIIILVKEMFQYFFPLYKINILSLSLLRDKVMLEIYYGFEHRYTSWTRPRPSMVWWASTQVSFMQADYTSSSPNSSSSVYSQIYIFPGFI